MYRVNFALLLPEIYSIFLVVSYLACSIRKSMVPMIALYIVDILNDTCLLSLFMPREKKNLPFFFKTLFRWLLKIKVTFYFWNLVNEVVSLEFNTDLWKQMKFGFHTFCLFLRQRFFVYLWLFWHSLCWLGWPWPHRGSVFLLPPWVIRLKVWTTITWPHSF